MSKTDILHTRIDPKLKVSVENTLSQLGLSTSDAINMFLKLDCFSAGIAV